MFSKPSRNHITIILEQIGAVGFVLITGAFSFLYELLGGMGNGLRLSYIIRRIKLGETEILVMAGAALLGIILVLWLIRRWYKTVFYIDGEYLVVEKNTLMHRSSRLPLGSISTVNLERNVFERIVGTAKIKLDINSAATANQTDFTFVLSLEKAKAFESALLAGKTSAQTNEKNLTRETVCSFTYWHALRDTLLGSLHVPLILGLIIAVVLLLPAGIGFSAAESLPVFALMLISWFFSAVAKFFSYCGFVMEKDEKSFYISSGLLRKKSYSFEKNKVNALFVRQPLFARIFGYYRAEVAVVGLGNDKNETPQICLFVKKQELERILVECVPDFRCESKSVRSHKVGLADALVKYGVLTFIVAAVMWSFSTVAGILSVVLGILWAVLSFRSKTLCADEHIFSYTKGVLSRTYGCFKYSAVQTAQLRTNVLFRRVNAGRIRISILSASAVSVHTTGWFESREFELLVDRIGC